MGGRVLDDLRTMKEQVRDLLKRYPMARNNDLYLCILWMREYGGVAFSHIPYKKVCEISGKLETATRVRRKIQNEDEEFLPTDPKVLKARGWLEKEIRKAIKRV